MNYRYENNDYLALVSEIDIISFEKIVGRRLPESLRSFLLYHGCGIIEENPNVQHRLFSPSEMLCFLSFTGYYNVVEDKDFFRSIEKDGFVFMEYDQETFFWISTKQKTYGQIFFYDDCIADSFDSLIKKIHNHDNIY